MTTAIARVYLVLWALTLAAAAAPATGLLVYGFSDPHAALHPTAATAAGLWWHNTLTCLWPLGLVALGWAQLPGLRAAGDLLIAAQLAGHGVLVGLAAGEHPVLWRYLPHLPFEWLGLAIPVTAWVSARRRATGPEDFTLTKAGLLTLLALAAAAVIETWAVPL